MKETSAPTIRKRTYELLIALSALTVAYGLVTQDTAALWVVLAVAVLDLVALVLARRNVEKAPDARRAAQN